MRGDALTAELVDVVHDRAAVIEVYRLHVGARARQEPAAHAAGVVEQLTVLSGALTLGPVEAPVTLPAGGQHVFVADRPHARATAGRAAEALLVMRYPS